MVTKRIRSEYMKKFKDPRWETYSKCYEEMLKYRLTRRLLEHTHNPWFWSGSDSDSDSGGRSPPPAPSKNQVELEECNQGRTHRQQETTTTVPRLPLQEEQEEQEEGSASAGCGSQLDGTRKSREPEEDRASSQGRKPVTDPHREQDQETNTAEPQKQHSKPSKSSKQLWCSRVRPAPSQQPREDNKDSRHPFALYGSGEKDADIAGRKTHNVRPVASTHEIHKSALRAKTRREVERQVQTQRTERRRAKSADGDKARKLVQPEFNPWLTEYMRCFSARS